MSGCVQDRTHALRYGVELKPRRRPLGHQKSWELSGWDGWCVGYVVADTPLLRVESADSSQWGGRRTYLPMQRAVCSYVFLFTINNPTNGTSPRMEILLRGWTRPQSTPPQFHRPTHPWVLTELGAICRLSRKWHSSLHLWPTFCSCLRNQCLVWVLW